MIRCINRLEEHEEGRIVVDGIELTADTKNIAAIRQEVCMVFQQFNLFPHLTVLENCVLAPIKAHSGDLDHVKRVLRLFCMCNCTGDFVQPPQVIDGASDLFFELWGPQFGTHARTAVGQVSLPRGIAVEINGEFELHT